MHEIYITIPPSTLPLHLMIQPYSSRYQYQKKYLFSSERLIDCLLLGRYPNNHIPHLSLCHLSHLSHLSLPPPSLLPPNPPPHDSLTIIPYPCPQSPPPPPFLFSKSLPFFFISLLCRACMCVGVPMIYY